MNEKSLTACLRKSLQYHNVPINEKHLQHTILSVNHELQHISRQERINFRTFLVMQIRFIGWKIWLPQGLLLAFLICTFTTVFGNDIYFNKRHAAHLLCAVSILVLMMGIPFIQRSIRHKMHETETAAYFSTVRLLMAKMLIIGIGDIFILSALVFITVCKTYLSIGGAFLYLIFPFLLTGCCCLYLLGRIPARWFSSCCIVLSAILYILLMLLNRFLPDFFQQTFSMGWGAVCLILMLLCVSQLRYIIYCSSYAEIQLD